MIKNGSAFDVYHSKNTGELNFPSPVSTQSWKWVCENAVDTKANVCMFVCDCLVLILENFLKYISFIFSHWQQTGEVVLKKRFVLYKNQLKLVNELRNIFVALPVNTHAYIYVYLWRRLLRYILNTKNLSKTWRRLWNELIKKSEK